jgi:hypothetical protein
MSVFGGRIAIANKLVDDEFAQQFFFMPMVEVVNADPVPDTTRTSGACRVIPLIPGISLGQGWSLNAMHERATDEPKIYYMARDLLTDVRKFDRFIMQGSLHNADIATGTRAFEVADGPTPIGFGRYQARMVEIVTPVEAEPVMLEDEIPF